MEAPFQFADRLPARADVAIVGAGFSGLMSLVHIVGRQPGAHVLVLERTPRHGPGIAYGECGPPHLLNVPVGRMGAFDDAPGGFFEWLESVQPGRYQPGDFVPRILYRDYLLAEVRRAVRAGTCQVDFVSAAVDQVSLDAAGLQLRTATGPSVAARAGVLALGLPGAALRGELTSGAASASVVSPWAPGALEGLRPDEPVIVVGTGLTALDLLVSLDQAGYGGRITCISRSGRFPLAHADQRAVGLVDVDPAALGRGPREALGALRRIVRTRPDVAWQDVLDRLRPHTARTWGSWPTTERARFLRHLRPFWEIHRHRAPGSLLRRLAAWRDAGRVAVERGTIARIVPRSSAPALTVTVRGASGALADVPAQRVFNCTGPAARVTEMDDPLLRSLLASGLATTDALSLGLCADGDGRLIDASGAASGQLYVLGALRRGDLWESTAVPELRRQAAAVGASVAASLSGGSSPVARSVHLQADPSRSA